MMACPYLLEEVPFFVHLRSARFKIGHNLFMNLHFYITSCFDPNLQHMTQHTWIRGYLLMYY